MILKRKIRHWHCSNRTALLLGQEETFSASSELLFRLCGVDLSDKQVENLCHHHGELLEYEVIDNELVMIDKSDELHYAMVDRGWTLKGGQQVLNLRTIKISNK